MVPPVAVMMSWKLIQTARDTAGTGALEIHLAPLTEADTQELVQHLLEIGSLPEDLRLLIRTRAEGNPFFVEEVLRMLIDQGALQRQDDAWLLSGTLDLGIDVSVPHQAQFEASLELPEGGQSVDVVPATLVAPQPTAAVPAFGSEWRGHVTQRLELPHDLVWTVAEADLVFTLVPQTVSTPYFVYDVTGGTMTFSVSGTDSEGCTFELSPVEIPITPDMAESAQGFTIDASGSPPTFRGFVHIVGPVVEVMQTCPEPYAYLTGPYSTSATGIFIDVGADEGRTVLGDRISGTSRDGSKTFDLSRVD